MPSILERLQDCAMHDHSVTEAAKSTGISRSTIYRVMRDNPDLSFRRGAPADGAPQVNWREYIKGIPEDERIEYLLSVIEMSTPQKSDLSWVYDLIPDVSRQEARVLSALLKNEGRVISNETMLDVISFEKLRDQPSIRVIGNVIHKLRRKIKSSGVPITIETIYGIGYKGFHLTKTSA